MQDREEELGRPLDEAEQAAILREHGHPMLVAGRYRTRQQLIGPTFFPLYILALKMGLGVALLVSIVLAVVTAALSGDPFQRLLETTLRFPGRALMVFAWTTLGFAALDYASTRIRLAHDWDPRKLPKVISEEQQIPRLKTLWELAFTLIYRRMAAVAATIAMAGARSGRRIRAVCPRVARGLRADAAAGAGNGGPACHRFRSPVSDEEPVS